MKFQWGLCINWRRIASDDDDRCDCAINTRCIRNQQSHQDDSFSDGLLEFPQYTRPREFENMTVPDVLLSGNHANIEQWRHEQKLIRTYHKRPDLLDRYPLTEDDEKFIESYKKQLKNN